VGVRCNNRIARRSAHHVHIYRSMSLLVGGPEVSKEAAEAREGEAAYRSDTEGWGPRGR
jgi:hypothetical protein